jgi:Uma2 family endonuclease
MIERTKNQIERYYDSHPTEEDLMGETSVHAMLIHYLVEVLNWLLQKQICAVHENLNFYQTTEEGEYPFAPDIAVIKGVLWQQVPSWYIGVDGPAPQVVFEIASKETWKKDLEEKPWLYAHVGIEEYYAYDPHMPPLARSRRRGQRLFGWHRERTTGQMRALEHKPDGSLWSPRLESFLVPDGAYLRLYDRSGNMRLTKSEAETERAEQAMQRIKEESQRAEAFAEKLRSLGIDPDQLI